MDYKILATFVLTLVLFTGTVTLASADGDVRYVAPSGSDDFSDCTDQAFPCATVQYAVDQADAGDEVRVAGGTYTDVNDLGGLSQIAYINKSVTIRGGYTTGDWVTSDPESNPTTLDAQGNGRGIYVLGNVTPTIEGLRITGGSAEGLGGVGSYDAGGGIYVAAGATVTISNCVIFDNHTQSHDEYLYGGGVYLGGDDATFTNNTVDSNTLAPLETSIVSELEAYGGGVYLDGNGATFTNNVISSNAITSSGIYVGADWYGGGLYLDGNDTTFVQNEVVSNTLFASLVSTVEELEPIVYGQGGGMYVTGNGIVLDHNLIAANDVTFFASAPGGLYPGHAVASGGGIFIPGGSITMTHNTIARNTLSPWDDSTLGAGASGGGVWTNAGTIFRNNDVHSNDTTLTAGSSNGGGILIHEPGVFSDNVIASNKAENGGGINVLYNVGVGPVISNNVISANVALHRGGGLVNYIRTTYTNNVFARNTAEEGAGAYVYRGTFLNNTITNNDGDGVHAAGTVFFTNTIVAGNTTGVSIVNGTSNFDYTLWDDNGVHVEVGELGVLGYNAHFVVGDSAFDADGYHLTASSAAIDRGADAGISDDVDGQPRPLGAGYDIGADEFAVVLTITKSAPTVVVGTPLTYTLTVENLGLEAATGVVITDAVPAGANYVSGGVESDGVVTWSGATVGAGGVTTATFTVTTCQASLTNRGYRVVTSTEGVVTAWGVPLVTDLDLPAIDVSVDLTPEIVLPGETVDFAGASSTNGSPIVDWEWDFGDGSAHVFTQDASYTYATPGTYTVTLVVTDVCGYTGSQVMRNAVNVVDPPEPTWETLVYVDDVPVDTFPVTVVASDTVQIVSRVWVTYVTGVTFTLDTYWEDSFLPIGWHSTTGNITQNGRLLAWDVTDTAPNAWHTITRTFTVLPEIWNVGTVTETLWVEDADFQPDNRVLTFTHGCEPLAAVDFAWSPPEPQTGSMVVFTATHTPAYARSPIGFEWRFGDGGTATGNPVYHTFISTGTHTAVVTATNACSLVTTSHTVDVAGSPFTPIYGMNLTPSSMVASGDPGSDVTYNLWLINTGNVADTFDVDIEGNEWVSIVEPAMVNLQPSEMRSITVTVSVASAAQCSDTGVITVTATSQISPTMKDSSVLTTLVNSIRGLALYPPASAQAGAPGHIVTHTLHLTNTGNCPDSFTIDVEGNAWETEISITSTESLVPDDGIEVNVWVMIPLTATDGENDAITVGVTSQGNDTVLVTGVLTTTAEGDCVEVTSVTLNVVDIGDIYPNTPVQFEADLAPDNATNSYAYRLTTDGIPGLVLTAAGTPLTWTDTFPETGEHTVEIAVWNCGMSEGQAVEDTVTVQVIPANAGPTVIYLPLVMRSHAALPVRHELEDAPDTCPGHGIEVGNHLYLDDFDTLNDHDWYSFEAIAGQTYTLQTSELELRADTSIALYGGDCTTILAENDDVAWPDDVTSRIVWTAQSDGTVHVNVRSYDWQVHGNDTGYTFGVRLGAEADADPVPESMLGTLVKPSPPARPEEK